MEFHGWGVFQPHTEGVQGQKTKNMEGFRLKYRERGMEQGIRVQWEQGKRCRGGVRNQENQ